MPTAFAKNKQERCIHHKRFPALNELNKLTVSDLQNCILFTVAGTVMGSHHIPSQFIARHFNRKH